jgi:hypothetical protein
VLASNNASVTVSAGSTSFAFANGLTSGTAYAVTVQGSPNGQTCSVANGSGTIGTANVSNVVVTCSNQAFTIGGTVSGLNGSGLVLANGADQLPVSSGATTFTMGAAVAFSSTYQVTVATQPSGLSCSVQNGTGTMGAGNVTNIKVTCSDQPYKLGGTITGLASTGLKLSDVTDTVQIGATDTTFQFPTKVAFSTPYAVSVVAQPVGMTCSVTPASGTMPAGDVTNLAVVCSDRAYSLGGSISGLTSTGLKLTDSTDTTAVIAPGTTSFTFPTAVAFSSTYTVTVAAQPVGQTCSVSNGGPVAMGAGDVSNVLVTCSVNSYTLGGKINGLTFTGLALSDGTDRIDVAANQATFTMTPHSIAYGSPYAVTVAVQPPGVNCTIPNPSGTMPASNVTDVQVNCTLLQWTLRGGTQNVDDLGTYPATGPGPGATGIPSARSGQMSWKTSDGKFWLFGGATADNTTTGDFNDVWSYDSGSGVWTWVSGSNTVAASVGDYTHGVGAAGIPPGRQSGAIWVDSHGTVWMFGGLGAAGYMNDLWTFNPSSGVWTWVGGTQNPNDGGVYSGSGLTPGSRFAAATWTDSSGHLWLFGGAYFDSVGNTVVPLNDLWMYDTVGGAWTLMNGGSYTPTNANYGTLGAAASTNLPGGRAGAATWVDNTGKVWLFGGGGLDATQTAGSLNDLWSFDPGTQVWTWVAGSSVINGTWSYNVSTQLWDFTRGVSGSNADGSFGVMGTGSTTNIPSGRSTPVTWTDSTGRLWLFGGVEVGALGVYNDLWSFDPATNQWTWVNGTYPNVPNLKAGTSTLPVARGLASGWVDGGGELWLFGGQDGNQGNLNDLWSF